MKLRHPLWVLCALGIAAAGPALAAPGTFKYDETSFEVAEGAGVAVITVERSQGEDGAVSVQYATSGGTATAGQDYTPVSGTLTWSAGDESDRTFNIPILNDAVAEGSETIQLALSNATGGATISATEGTSVVVILANDGGSGGGGGDDDDPDGDDDGSSSGPGRLKFDQQDFYVLEGGGAAVISVERSKGESGTVSVQYAASAGSATAGQDFTPVSGTLTWGPGDGGHKTFTVPILDDRTDDGGETILLTLSNPTGGAALDDERNTAVLRIEEEGDGFGDDNGGGDRPAGAPHFELAERSFQGIEGTGTAVITVERSGSRQGAASVQYSTANGSATAGQDYTPATGTLSFANGEGRKTFQVPILEDNQSEGNETVRLTLSNPTGAALDDSRRTALLHILDNDGQATPCTPGNETLCLLGNRFKIVVTWRTPAGQTGVQTGQGQMEKRSENSGLVWFFSPDNVEMLVKVLDACGSFDRYWVFFAATTNVDFTLRVTDTATGVVREYTNPAGNAADPVQDTVTFETCAAP